MADLLTSLFSNKVRWLLLSLWHDWCHFPPKTFLEERFFYSSFFTQFETCFTVTGGKTPAPLRRNTRALSCSSSCTLYVCFLCSQHVAICKYQNILAKEGLNALLVTGKCKPALRPVAGRVLSIQVLEHTGQGLILRSISWTSWFSTVMNFLSFQSKCSSPG